MPAGFFSVIFFPSALIGSRNILFEQQDKDVGTAYSKEGHAFPRGWARRGNSFTSPWPSLRSVTPLSCAFRDFVKLDYSQFASGMVRLSTRIPNSSVDLTSLSKVRR